jgi:hypothetical protein
MLKEDLEQAICKGTKSQEGIKTAAIRYRFNDVIHNIHSHGALTLKPRVNVEFDHLCPETKDKIRTLLQTRDADPTEVSPFADISFGIRRIDSSDGPLHIEITGDKFHKIPWVLTAIILEAVYGWSFEGVEELGYLPTEKGPKRIKNYGLFYEGKEIVTVMYRPPSYNNCEKILVKWLESNDKQILVEYRPAGRLDGGSRLGYKYFVDYTMFSASWVKQKAIEVLTSPTEEFAKRYEPTLAQTKSTLLSSTRGN